RRPRRERQPRLGEPVLGLRAAPRHSGRDRRHGALDRHGAVGERPGARARSGARPSRSSPLSPLSGPMVRTGRVVMADWRVTYMGDGVKPTALGAFAKHVTAFTTEEQARSFAGEEGFIVADPSGAEIGSKPAAKAAPKHEEPKHEDKKHTEKHEK